MKQYYVYIITNKSKGTLYTGVTNDLLRIIWEYKQKFVAGFSSKYNLTLLVYYEVAQDSYAAITREKQIKNLLRNKKIQLIEKFNPEWRDLHQELIG